MAGRHAWMPLRPWLIGGFLMLVFLAGARPASAGDGAAGNVASGFVQQSGAGADADPQRPPRHEHLHAAAVPDDFQ